MFVRYKEHLMEQDEPKCLMVNQTRCEEPARVETRGKLKILHYTFFDVTLQGGNGIMLGMKVRPGQG